MSVGEGTTRYTVKSIMDRLDAASYDEGDCRIMDKVHSTGYGRTTVDKKTWYAHRLVCMMKVRYVFDNQHVHHLCHNKACINPDHLAVVNNDEHQRLHQPALCQRGHSDWAVRGNGRRACRTCENDGQRRRYHDGR